jgi:transcriptional regulator with XRE-family HTH domain
MKKTACEKCDGTGLQLDHVAAGTTLRKLRKSKHLSVREVARRMDLSAPYVSDLELGRRHWSEDLIENFQKACR